MIESIELRNFKKHTHTNMTFDSGLNSVIGNNAVGKSSILKGVLFALFGASAAGKKDSLWNWYSDGGERSVSLNITLPEHGRVQIIRTPSGAQVLNPNGTVIASGNTAVTKLIEESLGMLAKDLRTLMYSPQGETQGILTMGPTALQGKVEGLARIDVIDRVLDNIGKDMAKYDGKLEGMQVPDNLDEVQARITELGQAIDYYKAEMVGSANRANDLVTEANGYQEKVLEGRKINQDRVDAEVAVDVAERAISQLVADKMEKQAYLNSLSVPSTADMDRVSEKLLILEAKKELLQDKTHDLTSTNRRIEELQTAAADLTVKVLNHEKASRELVSLKERRDNLQEGYTQATALLEADKTRANLAKTSLHSAICPTCKRAMEGVDPLKLEEEYNLSCAQVELRAGEVAELKMLLGAIQEEIEKVAPLVYPQAEPLLHKAKEELQTLTYTSVDELASLAEEMEDITEQYSRIAEWVQDSKVTAARADQVISDISLLDQKVLSKRAEQALLKQKLQELPPQVDVSKLEEGIQHIRNEHAKVVDIHSQWKAKITVSEQEKAGLERELAAGLALQVEITKLNEKKATTGELQKYLKKNRARFSDDIWGGLLNYASALVSNTTGGTLSNLSRSNSGEFSVEENGKQMSVDDSSGAQRSIMGLALRIALSKIFFGKDLPLILDEVSSDASDETAAAIAGMLQSLNIQIINVSHRKGDVANSGAVVEL